MTSRERIYKILNFERPDRIGIYDIFPDDTIKAWKAQGLPRGISMEDQFGLDLEIFDIDEVLKDNFSRTRDNKRFALISFSEPFQRLCDKFGMDAVLRRLTSHPKETEEDLIREKDRIIESFTEIEAKGVTFDGAWAWGDLAYNKGLFFSLSIYKRMLLALHKEIFEKLASEGLAILFHSDGRIEDIIPHLIDAGVRAFHPLEENSGIDIHKLFKSYRKDMVFMGHMDIAKLIKPPLLELAERIKMLKENCYYIYHADYPIMPEISFEDYAHLVDFVKVCGAY